MKPIDAIPVIEKLRKDNIFTFNQEYNDGYFTGIETAIIELENTLEIDTKPIIYAHWILEREPDGNPYCYHCSHCDPDFGYIGIKCASKYRPNCGATMSERIEDNG